MRWSVVVALVLGLQGGSWQAWSAPKPTPSEAEKATLKEAEQASRDSKTKADEGKWDEAIALAERSVVLREKLEPQSKPVITALRELAGYHQRAGRYAQAVPPLEKALAIDEKRGTKGFELQVAINYLARALSQAKLHDRAIIVFQREISLAMEIDGGKDGSHVSGPLVSIATPYTALRRYQEAEQMLLRAVKIHEADPVHMGLHYALLELGKLYREQGLYARAEPVLVRAVEACSKGPGIQHANEHMRVLASTLAAMENYEGARILYDRLIADAKSNGEDNLSYALLLGIRGDLDLRMGAYDHAEALFVRAQDIVTKLVAKNVRSASDVLTALHGARGRLLLREGDLVRAEKLLLEELEYLEKKYGGKDRTIADVAAELADLHRLAGRFEQADTFASRALAIREEMLAATHPDRAESRAVLGRIREARGDVAGAKKLHEEALAARKAAFGAEHPFVGASLEDLADLARRQGQSDSAEASYKQALAIFEKNFGPDHDKVAAALEGLSSLYASSGKMDVALRLAARSADIRERQAALIIAGGSDAQKRAFVASLRFGTDYVTTLHTNLAPNDAAAKRLALSTIFQRKGRVLDVMAGTSAVLRKRLSAADAQLFDQVAAARADVARMAIRGPAGAPLDDFRAELGKLEEKARALEEKLGGQSDVFRAEQIPVTVERVQAALPEDMVLIELSAFVPRKAAETGKAVHLGPPKMVAYVLDSAGKMGFVDLGERAPIERAATALRTVLASPTAGDPKPAARTLDELVMKKIRPLLGGKTRLLISADGLLSLIPFAALVDDDGKYLVEKYEVTYLTSGRDLIRLSRKPSPARENPVVVANPAYGSRAQGESALDLLGDGSSAGREKNPSGDTRGLEKAFFEPLPATGTEARKLSALMPQAAVLVDVEATESAVKNLRAPKMLHIATHGFFVSLQGTGRTPADAGERGLELDMSSAGWLPDDPLLRSGIALSGANARKGGGGEDGILTALEASSLDLQGTKLVVMSACETGMGDLMQGEGVYGLRRALLIAGAESLVASLWQVADEETQALMVAYYGRVLKGETRGGALRNVQTSMLASPNTTHPYYWASFGLFGNAAVLGNDPLPESTEAVKHDAPAPVVKTPPSARGCACDVAANAENSQGLAFVGVLAAGVVMRRRKRAATGRCGSDALSPNAHTIERNT